MYERDFNGIVQNDITFHNLYSDRLSSFLWALQMLQSSISRVDSGRKLEN